MPHTNGAGSRNKLLYYDKDGDVIAKHDSIAPGFFSRMHIVMDIEAVNEGFVLAALKDFKDIKFIYADENMKLKELAVGSGEIVQSPACFVKNDSVLLYLHAFNGFTYEVNGDTLHNSKYGNFQYRYQQMAVKFTYENQRVSVEEVKRQNIGIYPNPANDQLVIDLPFSSEKVNYVIYNGLGQTVLEGQVQRADPTIDLRTLEPRYYFISAESITQKLLITR